MVWAPQPPACLPCGLHLAAVGPLVCVFALALVVLSPLQGQGL